MCKRTFAINSYYGTHFEFHLNELITISWLYHLILAAFSSRTHSSFSPEKNAMARQKESGAQMSSIYLEKIKIS